MSIFGVGKQVRIMNERCDVLGMAGLKPGHRHVWGLSYSRRSGADSRGPSAPTRPATAGRSAGPAQLSRPTAVTDDPSGLTVRYLNQSVLTDAEASTTRRGTTAAAASRRRRSPGPARLRQPVYEVKVEGRDVLVAVP